MLKSALVQNLAEKNSHLYNQDLERVVNTVLNEITETLKAGGRVELRGFGAFTTKSRDGRVGRNPRTGAAVVVDPKRVPYFRASKDLLEGINTSKESALSEDE
jgi:integration host factor subunit beta